MKLPDNQCSDFIPAGYNRRDICRYPAACSQYSGHVNDSVFISE